MKLNASLGEKKQETIAFWGTLLFAVHPLVSEPVNYAAQTSMLLMMFFATLATYHLLRWHETKRPRNLGFIALGIWLASHAKEPGIFHALIPLCLIAVLVVPIAGLKEKWKENKRFRLAGLIGGGGLGAVFVGGWAILAFGRFSDIERTFHYALTQSRVLGGYFARVLLPSDLSSDHHIPWTKSWSDGPALVGLALVIASTLIILNFVIRHRSWFAVLCGLALFHLYLRFGYSVDELMVEYRMYPAMPWIGLLLALGVTGLCELKPSLPPWVRPAAFAALSALYIVTSAARSHTWRDEGVLSANVIEQYPGNLRAWSIYLSELSQRGDYEDLSKMRDLPQQVFQQLFPPGFDRDERQFTPEKTYRNYLACQYPLINALVHQGDLDEAQRRADILLVDVLEKAPSKNAKATFTALLAKLLVHAARGEDEKVDATLTAVEAHYDEVDKMRAYLADEVRELPKRVVAMTPDESGD